MWWIIVTAIGLMLSALLHYLIRHSYSHFDYIQGKRIWKVKTPVTRGDLILCYGINLIPVLNIILLIVIIEDLFINHGDEHHIVIDNWFTRKWAKIKNWLSKEV